MLYAVLVYGKATKLSSLKIAGACTILAFAVMGSLYQKQKQEDSLANSYNRLFNGIGWSMQAVHTWPANRFSERLQYFSSNQSTLQEITKHIELIPNLDLWGTSYWPTGLELLVSGNDPRWQSIEQHLNPKFFLKFLYSHPDVMAQYLQNGVLVFVTSNYAFGVLQEIAPSMIGVGLAAISSYGFQSVIWIYALLLIYFLLTRKSTGRALGIVIFMGAPFAVLLGDGFFEFEKHLMPFWITLPLLPLLVPSDQFHRTNH